MNLDFLNQNPALKDISPEKLQFILDFAANNPGGDAKTMASVLMNAATNAKKQGMSFSPNETDLLIEIFKQNMSEEERKKTDQLIRMMRTFSMMKK